MLEQHNLELLLDSHFPIVVVETHEERRSVELLSRIAGAKGQALFVWSASQGLQNQVLAGTWALRLEDDMSIAPARLDTDGTLEPEAALEHVRSRLRDAIVVLLDFHPYLSNPRVVRLVKEIGQGYAERKNTLVLISHKLEIPPELKRLCARFQLSLPDEAAIRQLVLDEAKAWSLANDRHKVKADKKAMELLVRNLVGLTVSDCKKLIRNAIYRDGAITHSDVKEVMEAKYRLAGHDGVLSFEYDTMSFADVGGLAVLKDWLERRRRFFLEAREQAGLDVPKGIMLLGVQGCGKSLAAKAVAGVWGVPLLRLDFGALYNKYIGETEKNIREAIRTAEALAPCVMWIDEIEKGVQGGNDETGTSRRVLGTLLTWLAEKKARVFIVATANDIEALPPELVRKGRLDEIFFVDLPDQATRAEILAVHLSKRDLDPGVFDLSQLAAATEGFSGAELEQAVVSARYTAFAKDESLRIEHILTEVRHTRPLAVVMGERIAALRAWARGRTVNAG